MAPVCADTRTRRSPLTQIHPTVTWLSGETQYNISGQTTTTHSYRSPSPSPPPLTRHLSLNSCLSVRIHDEGKRDSRLLLLVLLATLFRSYFIIRTRIHRIKRKKEREIDREKESMPRGSRWRTRGSRGLDLSWREEKGRKRMRNSAIALDPTLSFMDIEPRTSRGIS